MAHFATVVGHAVGLVEIFANPGHREWRELVAMSDRVDGVRAFLIDDTVYAWGSLPLHRDMLPLLRAHVETPVGEWISLQINELTQVVAVTDHGAGKMTDEDWATLEARLTDLPLLARLAGRGFMLECCSRPVFAGTR